MADLVDSSIQLTWVYRRKGCYKFSSPYRQPIFRFESTSPRMIIFDLACEKNHPFEGWFQSKATYDSQLDSGLILCPHCGSTRIRRVPSAVHLARSAPAVEAVTALPVADVQSGVRAALKQVVSAIVAGSEDVGKDFAQEARRIHYMEAPSRSIRGEASADDYELLREEGIDVLRLPIVKKSDLN